MRKVFISYSHLDRYKIEKVEKDNNLISKVIKFCDDNHISKWSDDVHKSGDKYESLIQKHIADSEYFLFISSFASNASEYCRKEIGWALELNKTILPFKIDESKLCFNELSDFHAIEYYNQDKSKCWKDLGAKLLENDLERLERLEYPEKLQNCAIWVTSDMDCLVTLDNKESVFFELHKNRCEKIRIRYYTGNPINLCFSLGIDGSIDYLKKLIINSDDCEFIYSINVKLLADYNKKKNSDTIYSLPHGNNTNNITQNVIQSLNRSFLGKFLNLFYLR